MTLPQLNVYRHERGTRIRSIDVDLTVVTFCDVGGRSCGIPVVMGGAP
ncbi:hypothetical protein G9272_23940 [Streptomyces asoensis]|uniref:Uncharacterized protein n=1 Tax=Streptomyces asoensis TaxID=249586 RepID=A0A6M4WE63_9ACTN|nr:hypothetical protein [Streptomyces asoensis]QJS98916.1 hypothetical protein G9272_23940 [Streptomyces asoensis]